jgi:hypothetical protein
MNKNNFYDQDGTVFVVSSTDEFADETTSKDYFF